MRDDAATPYLSRHLGGYRRHCASFRRREPAPAGQGSPEKTRRARADGHRAARAELGASAGATGNKHRRGRGAGPLHATDSPTCWSGALGGGRRPEGTCAARGLARRERAPPAHTWNQHAEGAGPRAGTPRAELIAALLRRKASTARCAAVLERRQGPSSARLSLRQSRRSAVGAVRISLLSPNNLCHCAALLMSARSSTLRGAHHPRRLLRWCFFKNLAPCVSSSNPAFVILAQCSASVHWSEALARAREARVAEGDEARPQRARPRFSESPPSSPRRPPPR